MQLMRIRPAGCLLAASLTALAVSACRETNVFEPPPPPEVTVQKPEQRTVTLSAEFNGETKPREKAEVRARVQGFLKTMEFEPSARVERDEILFTIEPELFEAKVASAKAQRDKAKAGLELASVTLTRTQTARERGGASEIELIERTAERDEAKAILNAAEASVTSAELDLSYTEVKSPIKGRVSRELISVGNLVGSGENTLLTTVVMEDPIDVYFSINERTLLAYRRRMMESPDATADRLGIRIRLTDGGVYDQSGEFFFADNVVDPDTGTLPIRAFFANPDGLLVPGMFVRVLVPEPPVEALLVPDAALARDQLGYYLMIVNQENEVERKNVKTGALVDGQRIIESGVDPDDRVIVAGLLRARPGLKVTIAGSELPAGGPSEDTTDSAGDTATPPG